MDCVSKEAIMSLPYDWSTQDFNKNYSLSEISSTSSLYSSLNMRVSGSFNSNTCKIVRVESPFLFASYMLKKAEYESRGSVQIVELYHDTAASKIPSIVGTNLDWRRAVRVKYGKGVSFSPSPSYANQESSRENGSNRAMIIADVLVGRQEYVSECKKLPTDGYDTTIGNRGKVYVKYSDDEFYPKYVVYYRNGHQTYFRRRYY